jgi:poly(3-hydroxybutyrate) depolymerase
MFWTASLALLLSSAAATARAASTCGQSAPASLGERTNVTLDNSDRTFMYWLPSNYDANKQTPVIFSFHGAGGSADQQADMDLLTDPFFNTDHILVYGQSTTEDKESLWAVSPELSGKVDDVAYVLQVLDKVLSMLCVDESKIYATGMSQGGGLTNLLACDATASTKFAAFAPVSGSYYYNETDGKCDPNTITLTCIPGRDKIPFLAFHGGDDSVISNKGGSRRGGCLPDIEVFIKDWAKRDGLSDQSTSSDAFTKHATKYVYGSDSEQGLVTYVYDGDNIGHTWPSDPEGKDKGTASFNASSIIMSYFANYTLT